MYKIRTNVTKTIIELCDVKIVDSIGKTYIKKIFYVVVRPLRGGRGLKPMQHYHYAKKTFFFYD